MKDDGYNEQLLTRYLLGNLLEDQMLQIEAMFLSDDQSYERLLALENELFHDYAQNKLSPGDRKQFEKRFLSSERNRTRAMIATALSHKMFEAVPKNDDIYAITSSRWILFFCPPQFCSLIDVTTVFQALRPVLKSAPERSSS